MKTGSYSGAQRPRNDAPTAWEELPNGLVVAPQRPRSTLKMQLDLKRHLD